MPVFLRHDDDSGSIEGQCGSGARRCAGSAGRALKTRPALHEWRYRDPRR
jgi:hypothetical protein